VGDGPIHRPGSQRDQGRRQGDCRGRRRRDLLASAPTLLEADGDRVCWYPLSNRNIVSSAIGSMLVMDVRPSDSKRLRRRATQS
jgi:hypothetical protein